MKSPHEKALGGKKAIEKAKGEGQALKKHTNEYHAKGMTRLDFRSSRKMMKHYNKTER